MAAFAGLPPGEGFRLLDRALRTDIRAVPEAPRALHALFAELERVPSWVDWPRLDRGGAVVLRAGAAAGIVLGMKSLILGYASPGGNKPLVFSGRLQEQASRRLAETCRFVQAVSRPRGMYRHGDGFAITLKVRLMHAQVRRLIHRSGRWQPERLGPPGQPARHAGDDDPVLGGADRGPAPAGLRRDRRGGRGRHPPVALRRAGHGRGAGAAARDVSSRRCGRPT